MLQWRPPDADRLWRPALVGLGGALPTLVASATGPSFLVDDWYFAATARYEGLAGFARGIDVRSRPFQALYHGLTFVVLGDHPVLHLGLLAALNGLAAVLVLHVASTLFGARPALLVALWWIVLPNRGATRFWISTGPTLAALVLMLLGAIAARSDKPAAGIWAVVAVMMSALCYEAGIGVGVAVAGVATWRSASSMAPRLTRLAAVGASLGFLAVWIYVTSPKSADAAARFQHIDRLVPALLGAGLLPDSLRSASIVVPVAVIVALAVSALPRVRSPQATPVLFGGALILALGAAPFTFIGYALNTDGPLDRANTFALVGVALLLAGTCELLLHRARHLAIAVTTVGLLVVGSANAMDLVDSRAAQDDGRGVLAALVALDPPPGEPAVLVPLADHGGWVPFGYNSIRSAYLLVTGLDRDVRDPLNATQLDEEPGRRYRYEAGRLIPAGP